MRHARLGVQPAPDEVVVERVGPDHQRRDRLDHGGRHRGAAGPHHGRLADACQTLVGDQLDQHGLQRVRAVPAAPPAGAVGALLGNGHGRGAELDDLHAALLNSRGGPVRDRRAARGDEVGEVAVDGHREVADAIGRQPAVAGVDALAELHQRAGRLGQGRSRERLEAIAGRGRLSQEGGRGSRVDDRLVTGQQHRDGKLRHPRDRRAVRGGRRVHGGDVAVAGAVGDRPAHRGIGRGQHAVGRDPGGGVPGAVARRREQRHVATAEVDRRAVADRLGRIERLAEPGDRSRVHLLRERHVVERGEPRVTLADRALGHAHQRHVARRRRRRASPGRRRAPPPCRQRGRRRGA